MVNPDGNSPTGVFVKPPAACQTVGMTGDLLASALEWADRGYAVLPLHSVDAHGRCSCRRPCTHAGKHPRVKGGADFAAATTDTALIREWWAAWPDANVGLPTGLRPDLFVIDLDTTGDQWQKADFVTHHALDEASVITRTGSGGRHFWYRRPSVPQRLSHGGNAAPFGIDGVHFRCDGGLVVVPTSRNAAGPYSLLEAGFDELVPPPPPLVELLLASRTTKAGREQKRAAQPLVGATIPEGDRNVVLTSYAGTMRSRGMGERAIAAALSVVNEEDCASPLPPSEVLAIAASVAQYPVRRPAGAFLEIPCALVTDEALGPWEKALYLELLRCADWSGPHAGEAQVSVPRLAEALGIGERTVERALRKLVAAGWIVRTPRWARRPSLTVVLREANPPNREGL